jgi:hypothetical protein
MKQPTSLLVGNSAEGERRKPQLVGFLTGTLKVDPDEYIYIIRIISNVQSHRRTRNVQSMLIPITFLKRNTCIGTANDMVLLQRIRLSCGV